jgi:Domain of unknown function (DUF4184)
MPFTISHAAVVLPFSRLLARWRLLSAVVIGAMVPDFGLFFPWRMHRFETHSATGLITFCLPVGLASYWAFQYLVKTPVLEVLPEGAYARWRPFSSPANFFSIRQWLLAACGVLAGAVTHLVWDSFTHEGSRGVRMIPWLEDPVVEIGSHHLVGIRLLQDGSSLIGLVVVLGFIWFGLHRGRGQPVTGRPLRTTERRIWVLAYVVAAVALSAAWLLWARAAEPTGHSFKAVSTGVAVAALRGLAMALLGTSLALSWRLRALRLASARRPP